MPPKLALPLHDGKSLAEITARDAERLRELAFRRKAGAGCRRALGKPGAKLDKRALPAVAVPVIGGGAFAGR
jgi:hypothetical protein